MKPVGINLGRILFYRRAKESLSPEERKLSKEERRIIIRDRFYQMLEGLSEKAGIAMERMEAFVRENPDATPDDIILEAKKHGFDEFPAEVRRKMRIAVLRYEKKRTAIRLALEQFSPKELFKKLFGMEPFGEVVIDKRTQFCIHFICEPSDYFRIRNPELSNEPRNIVEEVMHNSTMLDVGVTFKGNLGSGLDGLKGSIVVSSKEENISYEEIFTHEERHAMHDAFFELGAKSMKEDRDTFTDLILKGALTFRKEIDSLPSGDYVTYANKLLNLYRSFRKICLERAKDEIIAYIKGGTPFEEIKHNLLGALYDYPKQMQSLLSVGLWAFRPSDITENLAEEIIGENYQLLHFEYRRHLVGYIFIAENLLKQARTPAEKQALLAELASTPIERWDSIHNEKLLRSFATVSPHEEFEALRDRFLAGILVIKEVSGGKLLLVGELVDWMNRVLAETRYEHDLHRLLEESDVLLVLKDDLKKRLKNLPEEVTPDAIHDLSLLVDMAYTLQLRGVMRKEILTAIDENVDSAQKRLRLKSYISGAFRDIIDYHNQHFSEDDLSSVSDQLVALRLTFFRLVGVPELTLLSKKQGIYEVLQKAHITFAEIKALIDGDTTIHEKLKGDIITRLSEKYNVTNPDLKSEGGIIMQAKSLIGAGLLDFQEFASLVRAAVKDTNVQSEILSKFSA